MLNVSTLRRQLRESRREAALARRRACRAIRAADELVEALMSAPVNTTVIYKDQLVQIKKAKKSYESYRANVLPREPDQNA